MSDRDTRIPYHGGPSHNDSSIRLLTWYGSGNRKDEGHVRRCNLFMNIR